MWIPARGDHPTRTRGPRAIRHETGRSTRRAARRPLLHPQRIEQVAGAPLGPQQIRTHPHGRPEHGAHGPGAIRRRQLLARPVHLDQCGHHQQEPDRARRARPRRPRPPRPTSGGCATQSVRRSPRSPTALRRSPSRARRRTARDTGSTPTGERARHLVPPRIASSYRRNPAASAHPLASNTTASPASTPGNHPMMRATLGKNGKKRSPTSGTASYPPCAMSRYQAASQPTSPIRVWTGSNATVETARSTWRVTTSDSSTIRRDTTNGGMTAPGADVGRPTDEPGIGEHRCDQPPPARGAKRCNPGCSKRSSSGATACSRDARRRTASRASRTRPGA